MVSCKKILERLWDIQKLYEKWKDGKIDSNIEAIYPLINELRRKFNQKFILENLPSILESLEDFFECSEDERYELILTIVEQHVPVYTSELTEFLAMDDRHIFFIDDALREEEFEDGFYLLQRAYGKAIETMINTVLDFLRREFDSLVCDKWDDEEEEWDEEEEEEEWDEDE